MIRVLMMQSMAIHPANRIDIKPEEVIGDSDEFYEPFFVVERTMGNSQMKDIG